MNRIRNLFDLSKNRRAYIDEKNQNLFIEYDTSSSHLRKKEEAITSKKRSLDFESFPAKLNIEYSKKKLYLEVNLSSSDRGKIFQIFYSIAYLLGENILLKYHYDNFPWPVPKGYNLGGYQWGFVNIKNFILKPIKSIEACLRLFDDPSSIFSKITVSMLQINNINLVDVRFLGEFILLEGLSKKEKSTSTILKKQKDRNSRIFLREILQEACSSIEKNDAISEIQKKQIKNNLSLERVNSKGSTKDKIMSFFDSLGEDFDNFKTYIHNWNKLRSRKIAHGSESSFTEEEIVLAKELHRFLCKILYREFRQQFSS